MKVWIETMGLPGEVADGALEGDPHATVSVYVEVHPNLQAYASHYVIECYRCELREVVR